jgi:diacylglycerol kinase family enzyme
VTPRPRLSRAAAIAAILAWTASALLSVALLFTHPAHALGAILGTLAIVAGTWTALTHRGWARARGFVASTVGTFVILIAFFDTIRNTPAVAIALLGVLGGAGLGIALGRRALAVGFRRIRIDSRVVTPPSNPTLLCNPHSGGGKVEHSGLVETARSRDIDVVLLGPDDDLVDLARAAIAGGADCLGVAGGDGSIAVVADLAAEASVPLVVIPAGTRNHFALDLGIDRDDIIGALEAFTAGRLRKADLGDLDGRTFVNNASFGLYAAIVAHDEYRDAKAVTALKIIPDLLGTDAEPFDLSYERPDGSSVDRAWLVMVSNNPYDLRRRLAQTDRPRIDTGRLGVIAVGARTRRDVASVVGLLLAERVEHSSSIDSWTATSFTIASHAGAIAAGIDGEAVALPSPVQISIRAGALDVFVPDGTIERAELKANAHLRLTSLLLLAFGRTRRDELPARHSSTEAA